MASKVSSEAAVEILRTAFTPYHCGAEDFDFHKLVRFRVVDDQEKTLVMMEKLTPDDFSQPEALERIILRVRDDLNHHLGLQFDPWEMPDSTNDAA